MDGGPNCRNKAALSNSFGVVRTGPYSKGIEIRPKNFLAFYDYFIFALCCGLAVH